MDLTKTKEVYNSNGETIVISGSVVYKNCVLQTLDDYDNINICLNGKAYTTLQTVGAVSIMNIETFKQQVRENWNIVKDELNFSLILPNFNGKITAGVIESVMEGDDIMIEDFPQDEYIRRVYSDKYLIIFLNIPEGTTIIGWDEFNKDNLFLKNIIDDLLDELQNNI